MAIGEQLFSGGSKLGKTTINWGFSSKPSLTPEGNRIWQWYTKLWYRSFDPWIGVKKKNMLTPYNKGLLRSDEWMGKGCLGASSVLFQLLRWQDPTQVWIQYMWPEFRKSDIWYWKGTNYSCVDINRFIISPLISHYCSYKRELLDIQEWFYQINSINTTS